MVTRESDSNLWDRLFSVWNAEKRPSFVILGGAHYMVLTPNGEEEPIFKPHRDETLYSATSTGQMVEKAAAPKASLNDTGEMPAKARGRGRGAAK